MYTRPSESARGGWGPPVHPEFIEGACLALHKKQREARKGVSAGSRTRKKIFILFGEKWLREGEKQNNRARSLRGVSVAARRVSKAMAADVRAVF